MTYKVSIFRRTYRSTPLPLLAASALLLTQACLPPEKGEDAPTGQTATALQNNPALAAAIQSGNAHLAQLRSSLGLDSDSNFQARSAVVDEFGLVHLRYDQTYRGVRIWEGDVIVQLAADNTARTITQALQSGINISTRPLVSETQALGITHNDLRPQGAYTNARTVELVIYPEFVERVRQNPMRGVGGELNAEDMERVIERYTLAYHVHTELENGALETQHTDYLINAATGVVLKKWSSLLTTTASGTGNSQYSGNVTMDTETATAGFDLYDTVRTMNIKTYNLNHGTSGTGTIYNDADNAWGDGKNYTSGGSTTNDNGETAGVDAHFGAERTFDYFSKVLGRNGIDGAGLSTYSRVHYSSNYDNAFWSDACFCMTYGDGSMFKVLTSIDVAGHEMSHGVTSRTAKLTYSGESGGLNESMSDINGTMVEFYVRGGSGSTIGDTGGNWLIGDQLHATPLRYMFKPSKDGRSRDAWSSTLGGIDVHYSSGPLNRAFFFLSQGASNMSTSDFHSTYLPSGMTGIGNDKSARIAFRALSTKMVASTNYAGARVAFLAAAGDLYGATSDEYAAVQNAFAAINVGPPAGADTIAPVTALTAPAAGATLTGNATVSATATDLFGVTKVDFYAGTTLIGSDTTSPYSIAWNSATVMNGSYSLTSKAYDAAGNVGTSAARTVTVTNMMGDTVAPTTALLTPTAGATLSGTAPLMASAMDNVGVTKVEFYAGTTLLGTKTAAPFSLAWNTVAVMNGSYTLTTKAYDAAGNVGTSAGVSVKVDNMVSDTTAPTTALTAPAAGSTVTGTATLTASAMDNVGVTKVEFYAGTTLIGSDTTSPYSATWNSTTVMNGSYTLTSKAYDAAGNIGTSAGVAVTVTNGGTCTTPSQLFANPGFESGNISWTTTAGVIDNSNAANAHGGKWVAWLAGYGTTHTDTAYQQITIPTTACSANLSFWLAIDTDEVGTTVYDKLTVTVQDTTGKVLATLANYSNANAGAYSQKTFNLAAYKGQTIRIHFKGTEDAAAATNFLIDDTAVNIMQ